MLDLTYLRENLETARARLALRGYVFDTETFQRLDGERKQYIQEVEGLKQKRNTGSAEIGKLKRQNIDTSTLQNEMTAISDQINSLALPLKTVEEQITAMAAVMPNLPDPSVPAGMTEAENVEVRRVGTIRQFDFEPKAHWDLGPALGILDMERGAKVTGSRFYYLAGRGARLERALIQFMLDIQTKENGYTEIAPPFMVNRQSLYGTSQLPKFEEDLFWLKGVDYGLIPTAEVPLTNIYRDEILDESRLPLKFVAYSPCFRSEAGSYGKDVRGIFRVHQFNKVEIVKFSKAEESNDDLETLTNDAEKILQRLEIPYRVVLHCAGDMGFGATKGYDLEVWLPGQAHFREISSCSNFESFQARRANIRYRRTVGKGDGKTDFVHTLNGSGLAVGRTVVAILENYQQADGSVLIPDALRPYLGGVDRIAKP